MSRIQVVDLVSDDENSLPSRPSSSPRKSIGIPPNRDYIDLTGDPFAETHTPTRQKDIKTSSSTRTSKVFAKSRLSLHHEVSAAESSGSRAVETKSTTFKNSPLPIQSSRTTPWSIQRTSSQKAAANSMVAPGRTTRFKTTASSRATTTLKTSAHMGDPLPAKAQSSPTGSALPTARPIPNVALPITATLHAPDTAGAQSISKYESFPVAAVPFPAKRRVSAAPALPAPANSSPATKPPVSLLRAMVETLPMATPSQPLAEIPISSAAPFVESKTTSTAAPSPAIIQSLNAVPVEASSANGPRANKATSYTKDLKHAPANSENNIALATTKSRDSVTQRPKTRDKSRLAPAFTTVGQEVALSLDKFSDRMRELQKELHQDHRAYVKSRLAQARHSHGQSRSESARSQAVGEIQLKKFVQEKSPFPEGQTLTSRCSSLAGPQRQGKLFQYLPRTIKNVNECIITRCISYGAEHSPIPPYQNYISAKRNILVEDDRNRTFLPYHGDPRIDKDYARMEEQIVENKSYYHHLNKIAEQVKLYGPYSRTYLKNMRCEEDEILYYLLDESKPAVPKEVPQELVPVWLNRETHIQDGYFDERSDSESEKRSRGTSPRRRPQKQWQKVRDSIAKPSSRDLAAAGLACAAFVYVTGFSLWHIVKQLRLVQHTVVGTHGFGKGSRNLDGRNLDKSQHSDPLTTYADLGCLVCYAHECPGHGEYENENEQENVRLRINVKLSPPTAQLRSSDALSNSKHEITSNALINLMGRNKDGTVTGEAWIRFEESNPAYADNETCSVKCFWFKSNRHTSVAHWSKEDLDLLQTLLPAYKHAKRSACMLALAVEKSCAEIFAKMLNLIDQDPTMRASWQGERKVQSNRPIQRKGFEHWLEHSVTWEHHERPPFKPCDHEGACSSANDCSCHNENITCEKTCMCAANCARRFRGCTCATRGKVCWDNERCDCFRLNRECDPDICLTCGASEVLDPANRYREDITEKKCVNVYVQRGIPRRTLLGHSKLLATGGVSGWGLYMGEPTKKGNYIGEYVGEVVTNEEAEQRGVIYDKRSLSYLFDLNRTQTLDSTLIGNKLRYINHQAPPHANCQAKTLFCNTIHRIGMFASKDIKVGEEILFDYGQAFASKFELIELDNPKPIKGDGSKPAILPRATTGTSGKQTASKTGVRVGRPPRIYDTENLDLGHPAQGTGAALASVSLKEPSEGHKRKRGEGLHELHRGMDGTIESEEQDLEENGETSIYRSSADDDTDDVFTTRASIQYEARELPKQSWRNKYQNGLGDYRKRGKLMTRASVVSSRYSTHSAPTNFWGKAQPRRGGKFTKLESRGFNREDMRRAKETHQAEEQDGNDKAGQEERTSRLLSTERRWVIFGGDGEDK